MRLLKTLLLWLAATWATLFVYDSVFPPVSTPMVARLLQLKSITRKAVPLAHIAPALTRAVITAEDGKFCTHHGIDWQAMGEVVEDLRDEDGEPARGASTITMQLTKNLFLWNGRSYVRKTLELPLAIVIDALWSKKHIMENYLNVAEFGPGIFGAEAAARYYFHKSARNLTPHEAALLAATLPNPKRRNPARPSGYVAGYASSIETRSWQQDVRCLK